MADIKNTDITSEMIQSAQNLEIKYGIPTSVTLGQLIQESGGKFSTLASAPNHNVFAVKAFSSWKGDTVTMKSYGENVKWRKYNSYDEAFEDRGKLLTNSNYSQYTVNANTPREYLQALQMGGYAEDTSYVDKVMNVIEDYNLTQYDLSTGGTKVIATNTNNISVSNDNNSWYMNLLGYIIYYSSIIGVGIFAIILFLKAFNIPINPKSIKKVGEE